MVCLLHLKHKFFSAHDQGKIKFCTKLVNLCCYRTFPNKKCKAKTVLDKESSLNSNTTFSFINHVVVLNFSSKLLTDAISCWFVDITVQVMFHGFRKRLIL